ncbi:MAG: PqqD family protein [Mycobacteriales bacterium]
MPPPLRVNASHVVHETIDGETILIHLGTGTYYSLDGIGTEVWVVLAAGTSREALLAAASDRYAGDRVEIEAGISSLLADLLHQGLLVEGEPGRGPDSPGLPPGRAPFVAPVLHTYTDMQEFMLVDPLHDVDEVAGWPHAKTD